MLGRDRIQYKNADQVRQMRLAGLVVADALAAVQKVLTPGVTTAELDAVAEDTIRSAGAIPSFIGVPCPVRDDGPSFPATLCVSVNEEVVHGIPGRRRIEAGDVVSVDCGAIVDGGTGTRPSPRLFRDRQGRSTPRTPRCPGSPRRRCGGGSPLPPPGAG